MFKNRSIRNWVIVIVVALIALLAVRTFASAKTNTATVTAEGKVVLLTSAETIEASGSLQAKPFAALNWKTGGVVEKVNVKAGDLVKAGDILATLQPASTSASIVSAKADLVNAQVKLRDLLTSGTALAQAKIDLKDAQEAYTKADNYLKYLNTSQYVPQTIYTAKLVATGRNGWKYEYDTRNFKGPAPEVWIVEAENDLALKKGKLNDAQQTYDSLLAGEDSTDVIAARANVEAAQATVNLLYIIAPFDGRVLSVEQRAGEVVNTGNLSVNLADMDHLYVNTQVDESDIANVKLGNQAEVTLDAVPGVALTGRVTAINPVGQNVSGLVKYTVRVDLDTVSADTFLPLGTTANVVITVKDATANLAVPITMIQNDANGEYVWVIQNDGSTKRVDVVSGSIVGDQVVVTGDLKQGDRIQMVNVSSFDAPNPFSGGE
jgi:HlyD family secretion protein